MNNKEIKRLKVGGFPLIFNIINRLNLRGILLKYFNNHGNSKLHTVDSLIIIISNIVTGRIPLYELNSWIRKIHPSFFNPNQKDPKIFNDDRFGKAIEQIGKIDRASMITEVSLNAVKNFNIKLTQLHNDSTTIKACGKISGKSTNGLELKRGHSKDHRPDLKQLLFSLTITADGAVPIHFKTYPGNVTDDSTHIETWKSLCEIAGRTDFLYVADCKVCTQKQLDHITFRGGRVVTIIPNTWREVSEFKNKLRYQKISKKEILRKHIGGSLEEIDYYYSYSGKYKTKNDHTIHWIFSSEKKKRDLESRERAFKKVERKLGDMQSKINYRNLKTSESILEKVKKTLSEANLERFYHISIGEVEESKIVQKGKGRPGIGTKYETLTSTIKTLTWTRNMEAIKNEKNVDGVFPLLSSDHNLSSKEVLDAYKYQPRIEKRFDYLKNVLLAAPLLFKKIERVDGIMFLYFLALLVSSILEKEVRKSMNNEKIDELFIYPEERASNSPTTSILLDRFDDLATYHLLQDDKVIEKFKDELNETQIEIIRLMGMDVSKYWPSKL